MDELTQYAQDEIQTILPDFVEADFKEMALKPDELLFVYHYVSNNDSGKSYAQVYGGDSLVKCRAKASALLKRKDIQTAINKMMDLVFEKAMSTLPVAILKDIMAVRDLDPLDYYEADGKARLLDTIPREKRILIEKVDLLISAKSGEVITRYDLPSKTKTTAMLIDLLKMRDMSKKDDTGDNSSDAIAEARAARERIFGVKS